MTSVATVPENPYVGPQPFSSHRADMFFGRDRELRDLTSLLIAQRIVLLCSPSGAGKTSLIRAGLTRELEKRQFEVLPIAYVSADPGDDDHRCSSNRYVESVLRCLEVPDMDSGEDSALFGSHAPQPDSPDMTLHEYLNLRTPRPGKAAQVLIFDQFEEIVTMDPTDLEEKEEFFRQLGVVLADTPTADEAPWLTPAPRWALFAMREEFLVALDRYLKYIPTRLATRFRLEFLKKKAALRAIREPARRAGVEFDDVAASQLCMNLAVSRRITPGKSKAIEVPGEYIEPVHLQIICHRLWERCQSRWKNSPELPREITEEDLTEDDGAKMSGYVDTALGAFYAEKVRKIARSDQCDASERKIRWWIEEQLITPNGVRGHVLMGSSNTEGMPNHIVHRLQKANLVRTEERHGAYWIELAHDRLIHPLQTSNREWYEKHLNPIERAAHAWDTSGRPDSMLLRRAELQQAEELCPKPDDVEREFLVASRVQVSKERSRQRIVRTLVTLTVLLLIATGLIVFNYYKRAQLDKMRLRAEANEQVAIARDLWNSDPRGALKKSALAWDKDPRRGQADFPAEDAIIDMLADSGGTPLVHPDAHHLGEIRAMTVTDDWIITASADATAILWDREQLIEKGRVEKPVHLKGHWRPIVKTMTVKATMDQETEVNYLVTASEDETTRIWDISKGDVDDRQKFQLETDSVVTWLTRFREPSDKPDDADRSGPSVYWICSGHADGDIYLWRWDAGEWKRRQEEEGTTPIRPDYDLRIRGHRGPIRAIQQQEGKWLATASYDGAVRLWDLPEILEMAKPYGRRAVLESDKVDELSYVLRGHVGRIQDIQFNRYQKAKEAGVANGDKAASGSQPKQIESPTEGWWLVTAGDDGSARLWDVNQIVDKELPAGWVTKEVLELTGAASLPDGHSRPAETISLPIKAHQNEIVDIAISSYDTYLVTASVDGAAYVWNFRDMIKKFPEAKPYDGSQFAVHLTEGSGTETTEERTRITDISTDGKEMWIGTGTNEGKAYVWRVPKCKHENCSAPSLFCAKQAGASLDEPFVLDLGSRVGAIEFWSLDKEGNRLFSTACDGGMARIWKLPASGDWNDYQDLFLDQPLAERKRAITEELGGEGADRAELIKKRVENVLGYWPPDAAERP